MKKKLSSALRPAIGICLIIYVCYAANLFTEQGWRDLINTFASANMVWLLLAILYIPVIDFVSTIKWHYLARKLHFAIGVWRLFIFYIVGRFFNLVLPSSIGGDFIRVHLLAKADKRYAQAAAVVFVERLTGVVTLVFLALLSSFFALGAHHIPWLNLAFIVAIIALSVLIWFIIDDRAINMFEKMFAQRWSLLGKITNKIRKFKDAVNYYRNDPLAILTAFFYSFVFYGFAILNVWITALVFQSDVSLLSMVYAVPIIMFIMNIPLSIGGVGIMEFAYTFILSLFGLSPEVALSIALLMRLKTLIAAAAGAGIYPLISGWGMSLEELANEKQIVEPR